MKDKKAVSKKASANEADSKNQAVKKRDKSSAVKAVLLILAAAATAAAFVFSNELFGADSIFNREEGISVNHFVNEVFRAVPDVIRTVQIITIAALISVIVRFIMRISFAKTSRSITVIKLINNLIRWIIIIVGALIILGIWGVNVTALVASAGVLTLIIGLGAQSLVADIVAGVFIVCEGEFLVGDIVIIDGCRGTVQEIGIRTTKIVDAGGNVKIINNSEIKSVINQTQELSLAQCTVGIEYSESLERVEKIIREELPAMAARIEGIEEGPEYKGVSELAESSVNLLFTAKCKEGSLFQVQRDLNREIKLLFDRNNINIPFPQLVVSAPQPAGRSSARKGAAGKTASAKKAGTRAAGAESKKTKRA